MTSSLRKFGWFASALGLLALPWAVPTGAQQNPAPAQTTLAQRIVHPQPNGYGPGRGSVHQGAGTMGFGTLLGRGALTPNFAFMHRGEIPVGSGIGHHFHLGADEMFVILNGEAQFTINGRTAVVKGPVGVVCRAGNSHAIYNSSTEVLQWINFQVVADPALAASIDLGDDRVGATLDRVPTFITTRLDRAAFAGPGRGGRAGAPAAAPAPPAEVQRRRAGQPAIFGSPWAYIDHVLIQPGASTPAMTHETVAEAYYVMAGSGTVTVGAETAPIGKWDTIPVRLNDTSSFKNTGTEPLELLVYGVAKDMESKIALATSGGRGRGGQ
jgi:mannose-6-phosphate isomerase-like protein (cupin superfamily)